ncbi:NAD(P)/FAD-dependent oxidoreductase [Paenibacillus massiliensis]|uniref:NAD(P)/FAD-dependent oxidoreductase n=1 Tax=Paenibacillus massiliensis TaxID=225917 RepID=UPI0004211049|nr:FAD-dependent oxidoreductase [Paenibacillus massiliensis]
MLFREVIVIGAGIAGSSCALQLARQGFQTLVLDRAQFPRHKTCGEFLSPEAREMLDYLDVHIHAHAPEPSHMSHARIILPDGGKIEAPLPGKAIGISRYHLDRLLHAQLSAVGAEIVTGTVQTIRRLGPERYEVTVRQGPEEVRYEAKAVIGAYGTKQPKNSSGSDSFRDSTVYVGVKSHYSGIDIPDRVELYFNGGGYVGISPIEEGRVNIAALLPLQAVRGSGTSVPDILSAAAQGNASLADRLAQGVPINGTQVSVAPLRVSVQPQPWSDFPHVGDALMMIPPLSGDGMSIALRSALLCAHWTEAYLRGIVNATEWQQGYTKEAELEFSALLRRARHMQKLAFAPINRLYPGLVRLFPSLTAYIVKATRLSEKGYRIGAATNKR